MFGVAAGTGMNGAVFETQGRADSSRTLRVGIGRQGAGPGDVAMAGRVVDVAAFAEDPFCSRKCFAQGKVVGGDVLLVFRETLLAGAGS